MAQRAYPFAMTLNRAIRLMILGALFVIGFVIARACQAPDGALDRFATDSLRKLTSLDAPPAQPTLEFATPDGTIQLSDYHGKIVLLNAWATWCPPCVVEMPSLDALQALRGGEDFEVVTISLDRTMDDVRAFYADNDLTRLPLILDRDFAINARLELPGLPTSILYDRSGREVARLPGEADWASEEALRLIDHLIGQAAPVRRRSDDDPLDPVFDLMND